MKSFIETADSRNTSTEIIDAIWWLSLSDTNEAERIWIEPTPDEALAIWERVTGNGLRSSKDYCWGAAGSRWAAEFGIED